MRRYVVLLAVLIGVASMAAQAREIPVRDFFKDPEFSNVSLSPTGEYITVSVPKGDRTVLAAFRVQDMKLVGKWDDGANRHIDEVRWVNDERFIMYISTKLGRYDFRVGSPDMYASDVDGARRKMIPNGNTYHIVDTLDNDPRTILVARSIDKAFMFKLDVYSGETRPYATAPLRYGTFLVDAEGEVRYAIGSEEDLESITLRRDGREWVEVHRASMGGGQRTPLGFDESGRKAYFQVDTGTGVPRLTLGEPESGGEQVVSSNPNVEPGRLLWSSDEKSILAVEYLDGLPTYHFVDTDHPESRVYASLISAFPEHAVGFRGISKDGRYILLTAYSEIDPGSYYLFDRQSGKARFLLSARDWIKPEEMSPMTPITLTARDGVKLHGYLTLPRGSTGRNLPLVLHPHGGPHGIRDDWGFNPEVQFLANRGYAVLQVNFRGSGGYGNAFERMGYRNWGKAMVDDMTDAVRWAIAQGIADKGRICTYGASYGGYAALQAVVREPDLYGCAIGYVGVYSLPLMFDDGDIPRRKSGRHYLNQVMPGSLADQQAQSPAYNVDRIDVPVMLVQGAKDERVPISQYKLLVERLTRAGKPPEVTIVEPREGHGFYDIENNVRLYTAMEAFLDKHIGDGRQVAGATD